MRRSRWTRSSLLVPALLIELASETGTLLRGMNVVMDHDGVHVAAAAMSRALLGPQVLGRTCCSCCSCVLSGNVRHILLWPQISARACF